MGIFQEKDEIIYQLNKLLDQIRDLNFLHHTAICEDILDSCLTAELPCDVIYVPRIRSLASKALKLLFKLELFEIRVSAVNDNLPKDYIVQMYLKEIELMQNEDMENSDSFRFRFELKQVLKGHPKQSLRTFSCDINEFQVPKNVKMFEFVKLVHNYCPFLGDIIETKRDNSQNANSQTNEKSISIVPDRQESNEKIKSDPETNPNTDLMIQHFPLHSNRTNDELNLSKSEIIFYNCDSVINNTTIQNIPNNSLLPHKRRKRRRKSLHPQSSRRIKRTDYPSSISCFIFNFIFNFFGNQ